MSKKTSSKGRQFKSDKTFLDQYYTPDDIAQMCWDRFVGILRDNGEKLDGLVCVEPSCGGGAFSKLMPSDSIHMDILPQYPGAIKQDFLEWQPDDLSKAYAICTNPPYGWGNKLAINFIEHIYGLSRLVDLALVGLLVPSGFAEKHSIYYKKVAKWFDLVDSIDTGDTFIVDGKAKKLGGPTSFCLYRPRQATNRVVASYSFGYTTKRLSKGDAGDWVKELLTDADLIGVVKDFKAENLHFNYVASECLKDGVVDLTDIVLLKSDRQDMLKFFSTFDWASVCKADMNGSWSVNLWIINQVLIDNGFGIKQGFDF